MSICKRLWIPAISCSSFRNRLSLCACKPARLQSDGLPQQGRAQRQATEPRWGAHVGSELHPEAPSIQEDLAAPFGPCAGHTMPRFCSLLAPSASLFDALLRSAPASALLEASSHAAVAALHLVLGLLRFFARRSCGLAWLCFSHCRSSLASCPWSAPLLLTPLLRPCLGSSRCCGSLAPTALQLASSYRLARVSPRPPSRMGCWCRCLPPPPP